MDNYAKLITLSTKYATRMTRLSNTIFGNAKRPVSKKSERIIQLMREQPYYLNDYLIDYYPRHVETGRLMMKLREYGLYRDEHKDFQDEMKRLRELRGKFKKIPKEVLERRQRLMKEAEEDDE